MVPCRQYYIRITNENTLAQDMEKNSGVDTRPEVFFSGALHGNERIGALQLRLFGGSRHVTGRLRPECSRRAGRLAD